MITQEMIDAYKKQNPAKYELKKEALEAALKATMPEEVKEAPKKSASKKK